MIFIVFLFGLIAGSFINAAVWRIHERKPLGNERSECPECSHKLAAKDLVPVFSWLFLRGKCRYCNAKISLQYPLVELITAGLFVLSFSLWSFSSSIDVALFAIWLIIFILLVILAIYDIRWMLLPNSVMGPLLISTSLYVGLLLFEGTGILLNHLMAGAIFGGATYLLHSLSKGKWIGGGDVKLLFIMGLLLGTRDTLVAFLLAVYSGAFISLALIWLTDRTRKDLIPFGPFLIAGTIVALLFSDTIVDWYIKLVI